MKFIESRRRLRPIIGRDHRHRNAPARLGYLLALGHRIHPDGIDAGVLGVGDAAAHRIFEVTAIGADRIATRADDKVGVEFLFRRHRRSVFAHRFFHRDQTPSRQRPRFLRRFLIFDMQTRRAGANISLHGVINVHSVAVTGVGIGEDWNVSDVGDAPHRLDHLVQTEQTDIGIAIDIGRHLGARHKKSFVAGNLRHARVQRAKAAGHDEQL